MTDQELEIVLKERRRCVGLVLAEFGIQKAGGRHDIATILDALASRIEHPEWMPYKDA